MSFFNTSLRHHLTPLCRAQLGLNRRAVVSCQSSPILRTASAKISTWNKIKLTSEFDVISERFRAPTSTSWTAAPRLKRDKRRSNIFFILVSLAMFTAAAYKTNQDTAHYLNLSGVPPDKWWSIDNRKLREAKERDTIDIIRKTADYHLQYLQAHFPSLPQTTKDLLATLCSFYHHPFKFCVASPEWFIATMVIAPWSTLALRCIARVGPFMRRHMEHRIYAPYTLFTSLYNTRTFGQLAFTMYAAPIATVCGSAWFFHASKLQSIHESTPTYHMAAFIQSAGMFSLLLSYYTRYMRYAISWRIHAFFNSTRRLPHLLTTTFQPSTGFAGALYACITLAALEWRDEKSKFVFGTGQVKFSCVWAAWMSVEALLMLFGVGWGNWAAHLAGVLYAAVYQRYGVDAWIWLRRVLGGWEECMSR